MKRGDTPLRITPDTRTPCCARVPMHVEARRYACRGCGLMYIDGAHLVRGVFGPVRDVTSMTPERFRRA